MADNAMLQAALNYLDLGMHPIPCNVQSKKPWVRWEKYQETAPTREEVTEWWTSNPQSNIALVLGRGTFVVDLDGQGAEELLTKAGIAIPINAPRVKTGNGQHVYFACNGRMGNRAAILSTNGRKPQVDIRGDGGFVVAPPSVHENGTRYRWLRPLTTPPLAPENLLVLLRQRPQSPAIPTDGNQAGWIATALQGVDEGQRDQTCARLAGYFLGKNCAPDIVVALLQEFAAKCRPVLAPRDVVKVVQSISRRNGQQDSGQAAQSNAPIVQHIGTVISRGIEDAKKGPPAFVKTPFPQLDKMLVGGMAPGELMYLGARPGVGKTLLGLEFARAAARCGHSVLLVSREMLGFALARRMIAQEGKVNAAELRHGRFDPAAMAAAHKLSAFPIWLTDTASTPQAIGEAFAAVPAEVDLLVVDYLQLLRAPGVSERRLQVDAISRALKDLAMQRQTRVVCISSLARPVGEGADKPPTLGSLKESSNLEHDADIVLLLYRPKMGNETDCIVAKARDGMLGVTKLLFRPDFVSFSELESIRADEENERDTAMDGWS